MRLSSVPFLGSLIALSLGACGNGGGENGAGQCMTDADCAGTATCDAITNQCKGGGSGTGSGAQGAGVTTGSTTTAGVGGATTSGPTTSSVGGGGSTGTLATTTATTTSTTTSTTTGGGTYPAPHPAPPQVAFTGGPVLANPTIYPIFFAGDDPSITGPATDFTQNIGSSAYWTATTSEYGVGPATGGAAIQLTETAPATIDDSAIQTWLQGKFASDPAFPTPDPNTLVVIYYPAGTTITLQGNSSCQTFGGYHQGVTLNNSVTIAYAVVPRCSTGIDSVTSPASHEIIEASTDPYPGSNPAYPEVDQADFYWEALLGGGEVGDLCAQFPGAFTTFPPFNYVVQRTWSNAAANAGHDPCQPEPNGEVYFNAAPVMSDTTQLSIQGQVATVKSVNVPVGGTKTIDVDLFSDAPTTAWAVAAKDVSPQMGGPQLLNLTLSQASGQNGDVLQLTINVLQAGQGNVEAFYLVSTQGSQTNVWFGLVGNN